ncbi:hypothetical protein NicSoilE8_42800 (plasmid) [Arthrobacter sp. NicSoilE8]|nr:hypothetical protein NicSoilE8_42800 [Arthrobacter sp. NicSoilE8]
MAARRADVEQARREMRDEQKRWHRDQKLLAYQAFLSEVEKAAANWDGLDQQVAASALRTVRAQLKVLGAVPVRRAAAEVFYDYLHLQHLVEIRAVEGNDWEVGIRLKALEKSIDDYVAAVRKDLGTATDDDDAFRISSAKRRAEVDLPGSRALNKFGGGEEEEE